MIDEHAAWTELRARVLAFLGRGWCAPTTDDEFDALARAVFRFQFEHNLPYRAWCERRGRAPEQVDHWTAIPAVPTAAFKEVVLVTGRPEDAQAVFRTSGTTQGTRRGTHHVRDLALYHASLRPTFQGLVLPDGARPIMFSLLPSSSAMPDSSLVHMVDDLLSVFGASGSRHFATVRGGIDSDALDNALRQCERRGEPVCLLGTSFSFVHWLDGLAGYDRRYHLPEGSRLMDTGGFKGRTRVVAEEELRTMYRERLGIEAPFCVNEYGMTEMTAQFYDTSLRDHNEKVWDGVRRKSGPAWVRTRAVDPDTLESLPPGRTGLLQHFDGSNAGSVLAIQTEDIGVMEGDGFRVLGRAQGAAPRGCSIAMDELLAAAASAARSRPTGRPGGGR